MTGLRNISDLTWPDEAFGRSVNLKIGMRAGADIAPFRFTEKSIRLLDSILEASSEGRRDRAFSVIGPYGSGKSSFALLVTAILSKAVAPWADESLKQLEVISPQLHEQLKYELGANERGFFPIVLQGEKSAFDLVLCQGLLDAITSEEFDTGWVPKDLIDSVHRTLLTLETGINGPSDVIDLYKKASDHAKAASYRGLLVVADEFGKFLERSAEQGDVPDLIAAQYLAELASSDPDASILFIVLLHQNFRDYASGLTQSQRLEWNKIQGRFKQVDFSEESEDLYSLIAACLRQNQLSSTEQHNVHGWAEDVLKQVQSIPLFEGQNKRDFWTALLPSVYPFHPISLYGLPRLSSRLAQNERTLFTFLVSEDPLGFKRFLSETSFDGTTLPSLTFDVIVDFFLYGARFSSWSPEIHQSISQLESALERLGDRPDLEKKILKIIGGIQLLRAGPALPCNKITMKAALGFHQGIDDATFTSAIDGLLAKKIVVHRKFSDDYHLWEGSDFDFDQSILNIREEMKNEIDASRALPDGFLARPIMANQHGLLTGNARAFARLFRSTTDCLDLDLDNIVEDHNNAGFAGLIIHSSPATVVDVHQLQGWAKTINHDRVLVTIPDAPSSVLSYIEEIAAFRKLKEENPELQEDPVALKELNARQEGISLRLEDALSNLTDAGPTGPNWWWKGERHPVSNRKAMNRLLSGVADQVYPKAPIIQNELVNRSHLPSVVVIAVKKIVDGLLNGAGDETLGFEGNGPEVSIFKTVFERTGIYRKHGQTWQLAPPQSQNPANLGPTWDTIEDFLQGAGSAERKLSELVAHLEDRPYGLKSGIVPLLVWSVLIFHRDSVCLYYDGTYIRNWDIEIFDLSTKVPEKFSIRWVVAEKLAKTIVRGFSSVLLKDRPKGQKVGVNTVLYGLFDWYRTLPEYSRQTNDVSQEASNLRKAITSSADPIDLMFTAIPKSLGLEPFIHSETGDPRTRVSTARTGELTKRFGQAITDLSEAYTRLIYSMTEDMAKVFSCDADISEVKRAIRSTTTFLVDYIHDLQNKAFLNRAINDSELEGDKWLEALGAILTNQSPKYWSDHHVAEWKERLALLSLAVHDSERRRFAMQRNSHDKGSIRLLIESSEGPELERILNLNVSNTVEDSQDMRLLEFLGLDQANSDEAHKNHIQEVLIRALSKTLNMPNE